MSKYGISRTSQGIKSARFDWPLTALFPSLYMPLNRIPNWNSPEVNPSQSATWLGVVVEELELELCTRRERWQRGLMIRAFWLEVEHSELMGGSTKASPLKRRASNFFHHRKLIICKWQSFSFINKEYESNGINHQLHKQHIAPTLLQDQHNILLCYFKIDFY